MNEPATTSEPTGPDTTGHGPGVTPLRAGVAMMLVGAVALFAGMLTTTSAHGGGGEFACPPGSTLVASFKWTQRGWTFDGPTGNDRAVTISQAGDKGGNWVADRKLSAIVVKGGSDAQTSWFEWSSSGTFSNAGLPPKKGQRKPPPLERVLFCGPEQTTTTKAPSTTVPDSSVSVPDSSVSVPDSSVSVPDSSVSVPETSVSVPETSVSVPETSVSVPETSVSVPETSVSVPETTVSVPETTVPDSTVPSSTVPSSTVPSSTVPSSTVPSSTVPSSSAPSSSVVPEVANLEVTRTSLQPEVAGNSSERPLAFTGGTSLPLVVGGTVLLLAGAAMALIARSRERKAAA